MKLSKRVEFQTFFEKHPFCYIVLKETQSTSRSVYLFRCRNRVNQRDRTQIFVKKATIYENDMTQFFFHFFYTDQTWRVNRTWLEKNISYLVWQLLQYKLHKVKTYYLEEWLDKYVCRKLFFTLLSLKINKPGS